MTIVVPGGTLPLAGAEPVMDEMRRTSPLAYWRYAHDYLRVVRDLSRQHRVAGAEAQALLHLAAQAIDFALIAWVTARGAGVNETGSGGCGALARALQRARALGLPPLTRRWEAALDELSGCLGEAQFRYLPLPAGAFADLDPVLEAGVFILDQCAPEVARSFVGRFGDGEPSTVASLVQRLRVDLAATADVGAIRGGAVRSSPASP